MQREESPEDVQIGDDEVEEFVEGTGSDNDRPMSDIDDDDDDAGSQADMDAGGAETAEEEEEFKDDSCQGFFDHTDSIYCVALSPAGNDVCATGGGDEVARLWSLSSGQSLAVLTGHTDSITSLAFTPDGQYLASAGMDGMVRIWRVQEDVTHPTCDAVLDTSSEVLWISFHPSGEALIAGASDGTVWMWRVPQGQVMHVFAGHTSASTAGEWATDGKTFTSVSADGTIIQWQPRTGQPIKRIGTAHDERLSGGEQGWNVMALDPSANICTVGSADGVAKVINLTTGALLASLESQTDSIEAIRYATTQPLLAIASIDGTIALYEVPSLKLRSLLRHDDAVVGLHLEPNTFHLFTCSVDRSVRRWDTRSSQELNRWHGHQDAILCMAVQKGGRKVVTAGDDKTALVFAP